MIGHEYLDQDDSSNEETAYICRSCGEFITGPKEEWPENMMKMKT